MAGDGDRNRRDILCDSGKMVKDRLDCLDDRQYGIFEFLQNNKTGNWIWRRYDVECYRIISWNQRKWKIMDHSIFIDISFFNSRITIKKNKFKDTAPVSSIFGGSSWSSYGNREVKNEETRTKKKRMEGKLYG